MGSKTQKCIWMEAGAVDYQLCPLNLNCEQCDFYLKMSRGCQQPGELTDSRNFISFQKPKIENIHFKAGYQYLPGHFWFKHISKNQLLVGMDDILWKLVCPPEGIILSDPGTHILRGSCFAWIIIPHGIIYLKTPLEGRVLRHNPILDKQELKLDELRTIPVEDKWFLALEVAENDLQSIEALTKQEYTDMVQQDCENIYQTVNNNYSEHASSSTDQPQYAEPEAERLILEKQNFITLLNKVSGDLLTIR